MQKIGVWLREAREAKDATLEEAAEATRIRKRFLEAFEAGDMAAFPGGEVQIRGFLRIYARYLGLPPEEAISRYERGERQEEALPSKQPLKEQTSPHIAPNSAAPASRSPWLNERLLITGFILLVLTGVVLGIWLTMRDNGSGVIEETPTPTGTPAATGETTPETSTPSAATPTPTFPAGETSVSLELKVSEHVWCEVTADDDVVFEGILAPEEPAAWTAEELIVVETGNGAALEAVVNGQSQGSLCGRGEVCTRAWTPTGEVNLPTPTPSS